MNSQQLKVYYFILAEYLKWHDEIMSFALQAELVIFCQSLTFDENGVVNWSDHEEKHKGWARLIDLKQFFI